MTRKDYAKLAAVVREGYGYAANGSGNFDRRYKAEAVRFVEDRLVEVLAEDNPAFDVQRFKAACAANGNRPGESNAA